MTTGSDQRCPSCGNTVPAELGQHAESLVSGSVTCPHCGATVGLRDDQTAAEPGDVARAAAAPPGRPEGTEDFSGNETFEGLVDELEGKPQT